MSLSATSLDEALIHAVVFALKVEDLQRLRVDHDPGVLWKRSAVFSPLDGIAIAFLRQALEPSLAPDVDYLLRRHDVYKREQRFDIVCIYSRASFTFPVFLG